MLYGVQIEVADKEEKCMDQRERLNTEQAKQEKEVNETSALKVLFGCQMLEGRTAVQKLSEGLQRDQVNTED